MLYSFCRQVATNSARGLGLGALLAALPFCLTASPITVNYGIAIGAETGNGQFTYDPALESTAGGSGPYADAADGLESFSLTFNGTPLTSSDLLDAPTLPTVFLPGNITIQHGLQYEFFGLWVVSGSCTSTGSAGSYNCTGPGGVGDATILGLGRSVESFLASGVSTVLISGSGSNLTYNLGLAPDITETTGSITSETAVTPEPLTLPVTVLGIAGLWFARRRKAVL
jgi:hypothetical protein